MSACQPKCAHQNLGQGNWIRRSSCCLCRSTHPISSSEKLRQDIGRGQGRQEPQWGKTFSRGPSGEKIFEFCF